MSGDLDYECEHGKDATTCRECHAPNTPDATETGLREYIVSSRNLTTDEDRSRLKSGAARVYIASDVDAERKRHAKAIAAKDAEIAELENKLRGAEHAVADAVAALTDLAEIGRLAVEWVDLDFRSPIRRSKQQQRALRDAIDAYLAAHPDAKEGE